MMADKALPKGKAEPAVAASSATAATAGTATAATETTATTADASAAGGELLQREMFGGFGGWARRFTQQTPSWLVSMVVHMVILLGLALLTLPEAIPEELRQLLIAPDNMDDFDDLEELQDEVFEEIDVSVTAVDADIIPSEVAFDSDDEVEPAAVEVELSQFGLDLAPLGSLTDQIGGNGETEGVGGRRRGAAAKVAMGATKESEKAVAAALKWLAMHQMRDGGWSFNHALHPGCRGQCSKPGSLTKARMGATGMALLPFLGAGQTHQTGMYKDTVKAGLSFLVGHMNPSNGSMWEDGGRMYSHGLASIALCEAYAMTHDKGLHVPAQASLNFIASAQDIVGGGWRYMPNKGGDTSVVGWQIMALKSGDMAYLHIDPRTVHGATRYLDSVQANSGANYGYTSPSTSEATSAIGLLCRMYLGWKKSNPALERGMQFLSKRGPSKTNMYYNYYATQVLRHWEGAEWKKWDDVMRVQLVNSQSKRGHETGSWNIADNHGSKGGRLYCTAMAAMILEVYYRHMPLYQVQSIDNEFPE